MQSALRRRCARRRGRRRRTSPWLWASDQNPSDLRRTGPVLTGRRGAGEGDTVCVSHGGGPAGAVYGISGFPKGRAPHPRVGSGRFSAAGSSVIPACSAA